METLVVVPQHKDQYYTRRSNMRSMSKFGSPPCGGFKDIGCQGLESRGGLLPNPWVVFGSPVLNRALFSPNTPNPVSNGRANGFYQSENGKVLRKGFSSSPIPINFKGSKSEKVVKGNVSFSECWAGPACFNSPPPSSLPIPKFSIKPKRTVSLEPPRSGSVVDFPPMAKSAPTSPCKELANQPIEFLSDDDAATKTLRRILNLDIMDE